MENSTSQTEFTNNQATGCPVNMDGWEPIETAPHNGTRVELLGENGKLDYGEWAEFSEHFDKVANGIADSVSGEFSTERGEGPHTHWRPLTAKIA